MMVCPFNTHQNEYANNVITRIVGFAKSAWASVKAAFALPAPAQLAFA